MATTTVSSRGAILGRLQLRRWGPIVAMLLLTLGLGAYTNQRQPAFTSEFNLNGLLVATMPMALAAMGQTSALMVRAFDVSVGALMTMSVVTASFVLTPDSAGWQLVLGVIAVFGVALAVGTTNVILIRGLGLSSIIATLAMLSILDGISLWLRPQPDGPINSGYINFLLKSIGFVPIAFIVIVVVAIAADVWLYRTTGGLAARATGLDEQSANRRGVPVRLLFVRAFYLTAFAAAMGGLFLAAQVGIGDPRIGTSYTLTSIAAAVLGGASIFGGRGSFIGAVVGALFLNVLTNVLPFLGWSASYGRIMVGALTLIALALYQAPELLARFRMFVSNVRLSRSPTQPASGPGR
jgi:ribose transport system permease protein/ribose transport system ATP-binding protein